LALHADGGLQFFAPLSADLRQALRVLALYTNLFAICSVVLAGFGVDCIIAFGAVAATLGNTGPGFGMVGPVKNHSMIPESGNWLLILCILLGRLEIYTVLIFLTPVF
jgi:trk system potassium uptake protein TrkH